MTYDLEPAVFLQFLQWIFTYSAFFFSDNIFIFSGIIFLYLHIPLEWTLHYPFRAHLMQNALVNQCLQIPVFGHLHVSFTRSLRISSREMQIPRSGDLVEPHPPSRNSLICGWKQMCPYVLSSPIDTSEISWPHQWFRSVIIKHFGAHYCNLLVAGSYYKLRILFSRLLHLDGW